MRLDENLVLGLDIGIASIGWALVREEAKDDDSYERSLLFRDTPAGERRYALGVRTFSIPENAKTKEPLNVKRRAARLQRRVIRRRAQRMRALRRLLAEHGVPEVLDAEAFHLPCGSRTQLDPWALRKAGLSRLLEPREFAAVLLHLCKHRGFRSNSKKDAGETGSETGKMLAGMARLRQDLEAAGQPTAGAYMAEQARKRNRCDSNGSPVYERTIPRALLEEESDILFERQQALGSALATPGLRDRFKELAFSQRPLASVAELVGPCAFVEGQKRAPACAPTAEAFRLAQRLTALRLKGPTGTRGLNSEEIALVLREQHTARQAKITYKTLRKLLRLPVSVYFENLGPRATNEEGSDPESADIVRRSGEALGASAKFRKVLGQQGYERLLKLRLPAAIDKTESLCLDYLARLFSENDDLTAIHKGIAALPLQAEERAALETAVDSGSFARFKGTMRLSLKAMEAILPQLCDCRDYALACELAGFDFRKEQEVDINAIRNPVVQRVMREVRKQVQAIIHDWNVIPGRVHIEFLREVGKSPDERNQIERAIKERTEANNKARQELAEILGKAPADLSGTELLRYKLWKEQGNKCAYHMLWGQAHGAAHYQGECRDGYIPPEWLRDGINAVQIDHILPRSRTFDNSFNNLCLCIAAANQAKAGQTPFEWVGRGNAQAWHSYSQWVISTYRDKTGRRKRSHCLQENLDAEVCARFHERNKVDSSYAARLVARWFREEYSRWKAPSLRPDGTEIRRVFARPGRLTSILRQCWGIERLKKNEQHQRIEDDRHHAIDALVVACCTEGQLVQLTKLFQHSEAAAKRLRVPLPWESFIQDAVDARDQIFVSRALRCLKTGALHEETLRSIQQEVQEDGTNREVLYERKAVGSLKEQDLENIKDAHRCPDVVAALRRWLPLPKNERKQEPNLPRSAKGDVIRHVRIRRGLFSSGIRLQRGNGIAQADNGEMARTDVYTKNGKFYLVPVYVKDIADGVLPTKAILQGKTESDWPNMDDSYTFCFSLEKDCYIITQKGEKLLSGYFVGTDRATANISLCAMQGHGAEHLKRGIGVKTLDRLEKYTVDRLGRLRRVEQEPDPRNPNTNKRR